MEYAERRSSPHELSHGKIRNPSATEISFVEVTGEEKALRAPPDRVIDLPV